MKSSAMTNRPEIVMDEHLLFLDDLRASGVTNMFGAAPHIEDQFDVDPEQARTILAYWMETFTKRHEIDRCFGGR